MSSPNGLGKLPSLTQSSLRRANAETVAFLRGGDSERDFADKWGTSAGTVGNVQNHRNDLSQQNFLKLGERFGPSGVNAALALIGLVAVHREAVEIDISKMPHEMATILPLLIELWSDGENCHVDMRKLEDAGVVDKIIKLGDYLRNRRSELCLVDKGEA